MIEIVTSPHRYRVLKRDPPPSLPEPVYEGDDLGAAIIAFSALLPSGPIDIAASRHSVTGEPVVEARAINRGRVLAVLYGASWGDWQERGRGPT